MKTKISDELIKECQSTDDIPLSDCSECACSEEECLKWLLEIKSIIKANSLR